MLTLIFDDLHDYITFFFFCSFCSLGSFCSQRGDGLIDARLYVIALSTAHRPSQSLETLKLAFEVSACSVESLSVQVLIHSLSIYVAVQMYENEETGDVLRRDLAAILEIMLGVKNVELSSLFSSLKGPHRATITYGAFHFYT